MLSQVRPLGSAKLVQNGDLEPKSPQNPENTPRRIQKQIDKAIGDHHTSAGMINAVAGPTGIDTTSKYVFFSQNYWILCLCTHYTVHM